MIEPCITNFPTKIRKEAFLISPEKRKDLVEKKMREILEILGLDVEDDSLSQTPKRVAQMFVDEIFCGLDPMNFPDVELQTEKLEYNEMVLVKNIAMTSFCEHHFVPMIGKAHVAYIPHGKMIGLSKINRIVRYFSRRPQLQERLTAQIADCLSLLLGTEDVAVYTVAQHHCVVVRGVEDVASETEMQVLRGLFLHDDAQRREFFSHIHH